MERILALCFRSCLKGDNDREYYEVLELPVKNPTQDDIKRSYKKLSLALHPDKLAQRGIEVTAEHRQAFIKVKEAYDVLSDPKRKRIYDRIGITGLKMMESPQDLNPSELLKNYKKNSGDRCTLLVVIMIIFAAILVLPVLFCLKCDGTLGENVPWLAIWTPMWVVDGFLLIIALSLCMQKSSSASDDRGNDDIENDAGNEAESEEINVPLHDKFFNFVTTIAFILIQVFILAHLDHRINWSWFSTFAPWFIFEGFTIIAEFPSALKVLPERGDLGTAAGGDDEDHEMLLRRLAKDSEIFEASMQRRSDRLSIFIHLIRVWFAVFLALKLDGSVAWSWGLVLLPVWFSIFVNFVNAWQLRQLGKQELVGLDENEIPTQPTEMLRMQRGQTLVGMATSINVGQTILLLMALLLVSRLAVSSFSTFVIIFPVFVIIGCCCCGICCFLTMLANVDADELLEKSSSRTADRNDVETGNVFESEAAGTVIVTESMEATVVPVQSPDQSSHKAEYGTFVMASTAVAPADIVESSSFHPPPPPTAEDLNSID